MKIRTVRIPEDLWVRAKLKAKAEGVGISTVIRRLLTAYVR